MFLLPVPLAECGTVTVQSIEGISYLCQVPLRSCSEDFCTSFGLRRSNLAPSDWPQWPGILPLTHLPRAMAGPCLLWLYSILLSWMPSSQAGNLAGKETLFKFLFVNTGLPFYYSKLVQKILLKAENVTQIPRCVTTSFHEGNCGMTCPAAGQPGVLELAPGKENTKARFWSGELMPN